MHASTHIHMYMHIDVYIEHSMLDLLAVILIYLQAQEVVPIYKQMHVRTHTYIRMYTHTYVCMCAHTHTYAYTYIRTYTYIIYIHIY